MPRARRWPRRLIVTCLVLFAGGVLLRDLVVPSLVARKIVATLTRIDPGITVQRRHAWPGLVRLEGLVLDRPLGMTARTVDITYGVGSLLRGEVEQVVLSGATLDVGGADTGRPIEISIDARWDRLGDGHAALTVDARSDDERIGSASLALEGRVNALFELTDLSARATARGVRVELEKGRLTRGENGDADFRMNFEEPVSFVSPAASGTIGRPVVTGRLLRTEAGSPAMEATITIKDATARFDAADLDLADAAMELPISFGTGSDAAGVFSIGAVRHRGRTLGSARGHLAVHDGAASIDALADLDDVELEAGGRWAVAAGVPAGRLVAKASPVEAAGSSALAELLGLDGRVGGELTLAIDQAASPIRLELAGGSVSAPQGGFEVEGVHAVIALESLLPPATRGGQRLTAASGRVGKLPFRDVVVDFGLASPRELLVESAAWIMGDGTRFTATAARVDPFEPVVQTTIFIEDLGLAYWLPLLTDGRATGEGTLTGRIPIVLRPGAGQPLSLGAGFLDARSGRGTLAVGAADKLGVLLEQSDPRFGTDPTMQTVKQRLVEAFRDFEFDMLRLTLVPQAEGLMLQALISGRGRRGVNPQEVGGLTINIHNVEAVLRDLLDLQAALKGAAISTQEPYHG